MVTGFGWNVKKNDWQKVRQLFQKVSSKVGPTSASIFSSITVSGLTATRIPYASTGGLLVDSANLTFDGTALTATIINLTTESSGYQIDSARVLSRFLPAGEPAENINYFVGLAGNFTMTGIKNFFVGYGVGGTNTAGYNNVAIGPNSCFQANTTGESNVAVGGNTLGDNTEGNSNVAIGEGALGNNTTGSSNVGVGEDAFASNLTGSFNVGIGLGAFSQNTNSGNTGVGYNAGDLSTTGSYNVFLGYKAGFNQTTISNRLIIDNQDRTSIALEITNSLIYGIFDAAVANQSLRINGSLITSNGSITDTTGAISFGNENLSTTGTLGAGVATLAHTNITDETNGYQIDGTRILSAKGGEGIYNIFLGEGSGNFTMNGADNIFIGYLSGAHATSCIDNVFMGYSAGHSTTDGNYNTMIGCLSGYNCTGSSNVYIGRLSGFNQTTLSNRLIIDNQDRTSAALELSNSLVYGVFDADPANQTLRFNAAVTCSSLALGAGSITMTGSIGATGARVTKGWFTDLECTNAMVGGLIALSSSSGVLVKNFNGVTVASFGLGGADSLNVGLLGNTVNTGTFSAAHTTIDATLLLQSGSITDSSGSITFDNENLLTSGTLGAGATTLDSLGIGTAPDGTQFIVNAVKSMNAASTYGLYGAITNTKTSIAGATTVGGLYFSGKYMPASPTAAKHVDNLFGAEARAILQSENNEYTLGADNIWSYRSNISGVQGGAGQVTLSNVKHFWVQDLALSGGAVCTLQYAFYDAGLTAAVTNWGFYGKSANNLLEDNCKWLLGTGSDLQLYHDGTNSYIYNDTGILKIQDAGSGINVGTAITELVGFYGVAPVDQPATVADAATQDVDGLDTVDEAKVEADLTSCKNAINAIIDRLQELGLIA